MGILSQFILNLLVVVREQLIHSMPENANDKNTIIAYEPVWAIGTGKTPSLEQITEMHKYIENVISEDIKQFQKTPRIIYGGSIKPENAKQILGAEGVSGLLVGKASLDADDFWKIVEAAS